MKKQIKIEEIKTLEDKNIIKIITKIAHCFAISSSNIIYGWGNNENGQLGFGDKKNRNLPEEIPYFKGIEIDDVKCGSRHSFFIEKNFHNIYCCGDNNLGELGPENNKNYEKPQKFTFFKDKNNIIEISSGSFHLLCLLKNNEVYSWGYNYYGQLGLGDTNNNRNTSQIIEYLNDKKIIQIYCLNVSSLALSRIYLLF